MLIICGIALISFLILGGLLFLQLIILSFQNFTFGGWMGVVAFFYMLAVLIAAFVKEITKKLKK